MTGKIRGVAFVPDVFLVTEIRWALVMILDAVHSYMPRLKDPMVGGWTYLHLKKWRDDVVRDHARYYLDISFVSTSSEWLDFHDCLNNSQLNEVAL